MTKHPVIEVKLPDEDWVIVLAQRIANRTGLRVVVTDAKGREVCSVIRDRMRDH